MSLSDTLPFPRPDAARPTEAFESLLQMQVALAGQLWKANGETVEFMAERLRKDAAFAATLATTRMPTEAARLVFGHMQDAWADYADQAMRWGTMFRMGEAQTAEDAPAPVPMAPGMGAAMAGTAADAAAAQPSVPAQARAGGGGKPPRSEPV